VKERVEWVERQERATPVPQARHHAGQTVGSTKRTGPADRPCEPPARAFEEMPFEAIRRLRVRGGETGQERGTAHAETPREKFARRLTAHLVDRRAVDEDRGEFAMNVRRGGHRSIPSVEIRPLRGLGSLLRAG